ncbi:MAG: response regulator transcription factor [Planctomycetes bacterium]|nr:response regulator transcription factor [Planctomycetota bacterium]
MEFGTQPEKPLICLLGQSALDRRAYRLLLRMELRHEVAVEADFAPTSVWAAMRTRPALVLVDADVASAEIVEAVQMIARLRPETAILVLSAAVEPRQVQAWGTCPISGYVVKDGGLEDLRAALKAVLAGGRFFSDGVRAALRSGQAGRDGKPKLSRRETELLPLLAVGLTLREAASKMTISYKTADSYRTSLLRKLGLRDRIQLVRYAIRQRIVEP